MYVYTKSYLTIIIENGIDETIDNNRLCMYEQVQHLYYV